MRIALTGDVMLGRLVAEAMETQPAEYFWGDTLPLLRSADFSLINLECALTTSEEKWIKTPKVFHFKADPQRAAQVLEAAGIDFVTLANNHVLDFEEAGLRETLTTLEKAGIGFCGAGRDLEEAAAAKYAEAGGKVIAVVGATDNTPEWQANGGPGVQYMEFNKASAELFSQQVEAAAQKADLVIASLHWGPNMREHPTDDFRDFAHALIESGADIVHGHSAHIFQGIEIRRNKPIFYDTGDYIDDYAVDPLLRNDRGFLFMVDFDTSVRTIELYPIVIDHFQVNLAAGEDNEQVIERMEKLSAEMGTRLKRSDGKLCVDLAEKAHPRTPASF